MEGPSSPMETWRDEAGLGAGAGAIPQDGAGVGGFPHDGGGELGVGQADGDGDGLLGHGLGLGLGLGLVMGLGLGLRLGLSGGCGTLMSTFCPASQWPGIPQR